MNIKVSKIGLHITLIVAITALLALCIVYPFLPGGYDGLAVALSTMAQVLGVFGMLLVPIGILWLVYKYWKRTRVNRNRLQKDRSYYFALAAVIVASLVVMPVAFVGAATRGASLGLLTLIMWFYMVSRLIRKIRSLKHTAQEGFSFAPLYLTIIPVTTLLFQFTLAAPITRASRDHAISMSAEIIEAIENYRVENGRYPLSLVANWPDYSPAIVGVEQFQYAPQGDAYNLVFQQPRFLFDDIGVREFVVYNPLDQHTIMSHASWILLLSPAQARSSQGWYAVRQASAPHWKYFLFD